VVLLDLYKKKRIYRKDAPAMWCPECRTGVAQVEVQDKEINSYFNEILFEVEEEKLKLRQLAQNFFQHV